jgi:hypothetical protein
MSSADLRVDGAESGETDGSAGSGPAEGSKDEDLERGKGTAVEGQESHTRKHEDLLKRIKEVEERMKDSLSQPEYGGNEMCMHGVYMDGRCGICSECEKLGCWNDREKHDQIKDKSQATRAFQQRKKPSLCEVQ